MKKPMRPMAKKAATVNKAQSGTAKVTVKKTASAVAEWPKEKGAARKKASARRAPARPASAEPDIEAYGEAEVPPAVLGQDRSRQRTRFRELTWAQFDTLVQGLAREISQSFEPDAVVGVAHGGVFVGGAMARSLSREFFPVRISRRSRDKGPTDEPRIYGEMPAELKGRRVLIVDDVAASGDTLELAKALARKAGAKEVATACLVSREQGYSPDWCAVQTDDLVVFPWDYDLQGDHRFRGA